jgi:hypothetical protein
MATEAISAGRPPVDYSAYERASAADAITRPASPSATTPATPSSVGYSDTSSFDGPPSAASPASDKPQSGDTSQPSFVSSFLGGLKELLDKLTGGSEHTKETEETKKCKVNPDGTKDCEETKKTKTVDKYDGVMGGLHKVWDSLTGGIKTLWDWLTGSGK